MTIRAIAPLPIREDWTPAYLRARHDQNRDYAFKLTDAQGAPSSDGRRYHSGVDWFAPGGEPVVSPVDGLIVGWFASGMTSGQVFGGTLKIQDAEGVVWVMRHVDPSPTHSAGHNVKAGEVVAKVTPWHDGGPHLHLEIWRSRAGGYRHENMIDPRTVEWVTASTFERPEPVELPHGGTLRLALNGETYAGWNEVGNRLKWIARNGLSPEATTAIAWRGAIWAGPVHVTNVAKHLVKKYLDMEGK